jgi:NAD(P)-dependent dehydrogenase (short-subunit alcohol dehydrogenase family)
MDVSQAQHAFITGGASGIGLALGEALAAKGVAVTLADANVVTLERAGLQFGDKVHRALLDVRDRDGWARAKTEAEAAFGPVDLLFNNAGIAPDGNELADIDPISFDRIIAINLTGVFNGISTFGAALRAAGRGHVVNTASMAGMVAEHPGLGSYAASKFAVVAMSEVLRKEMAPHGVGVSVLCPGMVATDLPGNTKAVGGSVRDGDNVLLDYGIAPSAVAELVLDRIEANELYIFTHPERWEAVKERFAAIGAAFGGID